MTSFSFNQLLLVGLFQIILGTFDSVHQTTASSAENRVTRQIYSNWLYNPFYFYGPPLSPSSPYFDVPYKFRNSFIDGPSETDARLNGLGINAINNIVFNNRILSLDSCTGSSGESGVCATRAVCSVLGGTSSGSCSRGRICCINSVSTCGRTITVNNTYWQSPSSVSAPSICSLTVKLDSNLIEQSKAICQVRLDFSDFSIAQPSATSGTSRGTCDVDTFDVVGATNTVPIICGDNAGQHMYLTVPNSGTSATNLQLNFKLRSSPTTPRSWKIKAAFLPCNADYLAPDNCLQYFTTATGTVSSFNFKDTAPASRKLANQAYSICFRTEVVNGQDANQLCLDECSVSSGNDAFRVSGDGDVSQFVDLLGFCQRDYLVFIGGTNSNGLSLDRYCGGALNSASISAKDTVCSKMTPFKIIFKTDGTEVVSVAGDANAIPPIDPVTGDDLNVGFCLNFSQKVVSS